MDGNRLLDRLESGQTPRRSAKGKQGGKKLPFAIQTTEYCNRAGDDEFAGNPFAMSEEGVGVRALIGLWAIITHFLNLVAT